MLTYGTDTGVSAHGDNAQEFVWMVEAGMPAMDAIKSATIVPAKFMGADDRYGTVQAGKVADLVAVPGDPLADITVLQDKGRILSVMKDGVFHREPPVGAGRPVRSGAPSTATRWNWTGPPCCGRKRAAMFWATRLSSARSTRAMPSAPKCAA